MDGDGEGGLISESDSDTHLLEDYDISAQSDSDNDSNTDVPGTNFTQWTDNTNCRPTVPLVYRCMGGPIVLQLTKPPHTNIGPFPLSI
jgi:hypothetical protein